jgi:CelD/BcsL family acetyltransferase involved in cellulose biosynthesis
MCCKKLHDPNEVKISKFMQRWGFLKINGTWVAEQYAIESPKSYWLLNIGYDEKHCHCSPGNLLLEESIKYADRSGLLRYNFLGKAQPWTARWTKITQDCLILTAYRLNLYGMKAICSDIGYLIAKRIKNHKMKNRNSRE